MLGSDLDEEEREFLKHTYGNTPATTTTTTTATTTTGAPTSPSASASALPAAAVTLERTPSGGLRSPILARQSVKTLANKFDK
jgi:hypothetical protein